MLNGMFIAGTGVLYLLTILVSFAGLLTVTGKIKQACTKDNAPKVLLIFCNIGMWILPSVPLGGVLGMSSAVSHGVVFGVLFMISMFALGAELLIIMFSTFAIAGESF